MKLFSFDKYPKYDDYSKVSADMHSHLIPAIDDGSQNMEDSIELIRNMYSLGYKKLITTPHIISDSYNNNPQNIKDGFERLVKGLQDADKELSDNIQLGYAAEYLLDDSFFTKYINNKEPLLTINIKKSNTGITRYLLMELPFIHEPEILNSAIFELQTSGYKIILAHPERYSYYYDNLQRYEDLHDRGVLFQLNLLSLSAYYSLPTKKTAEWLVEKEMISFLGSDIHNLKYIEFMKKTLKEKSLRKLLASDKLMNNILHQAVID